MEHAHWVALNPADHGWFRVDGLTLHNVGLDPQRMGGYGKTKEAIWSTVHGLDAAETSEDLFWSDEFSGSAF